MLLIKRKIIIFFIIILYITLFKTNLYAKETENNIDIEEIKRQQSETINYEEIQKVIDEFLIEDYNFNFNFKDFILKSINGEYDIDSNNIFSLLLNEIFKDIKSNINIMIQLLIICIVSAFFKNFTESFQSQQLTDTGFLIIFLLITTLIIQSYHILNNIAVEVIDGLLIFVQALVPSLLTVIVLSGATISATMFGESILMLIGIIDNGIKTFLLPILYVLMLFIIINTLTENNSLSKMVELLKKAYEWIIKIILWIFIGFFGLQSFGLPVVDGFMSRTAKQTIGIVPVVGSSLAEISDIVLGCGTMIKNAFGVGSIIVIILLAIVPIIKITIIALIYKTSAAIVEPITDKRIVSCLSDVGDLCFLLLGTVLLTIIMFIIAITITLYLTNILLFIR